MSLVYDISLKHGLYDKYKKVASRLPAGCSVLEIGCHTGQFSRALIELGHQVIGVESNSEATRIAQRNGVQVICEDIENPKVLMSLGRTFDVVLLMDILEHVRNPLDLLQRLKPVLSNQGRIIVTGPNVAFWGVRRDLLLGKWNYEDAGIMDRTHLHFYTASTWQALVEESGYKVTSFEPAKGGLPLVHLLARIPFFHGVPVFMTNLGVRLLPNLFTVVFLIEAVPIADSAVIPRKE